MEQTCTRQSPAVQGIAGMAKRGPETGKRGDHD